MSVQVAYEIAHKAWKNIKPTKEGHTHDWSVFVQGVNGNEIQHIVEKVVFHLPDTYPDPLQIKEKPPFVLSESTSQSFFMQIEIFFCAGSKLTKVSHVYDISIGDEEVSNSSPRNLTFRKPNKDFKEKLLLAGGKVVDLQKTFEENAPFIKCKVEPDEEIEIIKDIDNVEALNSTVEKNDDLQNESMEDPDVLRFSELLKENEDLKIAIAKVKEKTFLQEKLIDFYEKKFSAWEAGILTSNMCINQLRKKIEAKETEISTLNLQVQILKNEFSNRKNSPAKNFEKKKGGRKRKNKEDLNKSAPVEKKRGNVIQPTKVMSSPSRNDSCTSKSPSNLKNFSVSRKNQNVWETVATKSSPSISQNSSLSKTDAMLNVSRNKSSENHFYSQSKSEIQPVNAPSDNSSFQQNVCGELNLKSLNSHKNVSSATFSFNSVNTNNVWIPVGRNSVAVNALNKCKIKNTDCVQQDDEGSMEVSLLYVPETRNDVKPMEVVPVTANASLNKPEIRNSDIEEPVEKNSVEINASLNKLETKSIDVVKPMELNSVTANASLNEPEIRNSIIEEPVKINSGEKLMRGNSSNADAALNKSKTRNGGVERLKSEMQPINFRSDNSFQQNVSGELNLESSNSHKNVSSGTFSFKSANTYDVWIPVGKNFVSVNGDPNKSKIKNSDCVKQESRSSVEVSSMYVPETRNDVKPMEVIPVTANASLNKSEIRKSSVEINASLNKPETKNVDVVKPMEVNSVTANASLNKPEIRNKNIKEPFKMNSGEKLMRGSSVNVDSALNKSKTRDFNVQRPVRKKSVEINASLNKPETKNVDVVKPMGVNSVTANATLNKPEIRNNNIKEPVKMNSGEKLMRGSSVNVDSALNKSKTRDGDVERPVGKKSVEINASLKKPETKNVDVVKPMEVNSVTANTSLNKPEITNNNIKGPVKMNSGEKLMRGSSVNVDSALNKSKTRDGDVERPVGKKSVEINASLKKPETKNFVVVKPMEVNSVTANTSLNKPEISESDIEELMRINDGEKTPKGSSAEVSLNKSVKRNTDDEKIVKGSSVEVTTCLNKFEKSDDAVKPIEENSTEAHSSITEQCTELYNKNLVKESVDTSVKEQHVSSTERMNIKSLNSNSTETGKKHSTFGRTISNPSNIKSHRRAKNQKPNNGYLEKVRNLQKENFRFNTIWKESLQDINDSPAANLIDFMTIHYPKLAAELDRIHNSKFSHLKHKTNPLFYKLGNINSGISEKYFTRYICSLTDFLTNPKTSFDIATIVYLIVDYLSSSKIKSIDLPTYNHNQEVYTILPQSENCIVSAIYEVEKKSIPHLHGLLISVFNVIHRVIISKKRMAVSGLASLCRVFMDLCKLCHDRWQPLFLCCELLKFGHPFAPYLINSLAGVWRDPFYVHNKFSVEERMLLGSIIYGLNVKPLLMDSDLWRLTCKQSTTYFPFPVLVDPHEAIQFLTEKIISRCNEGLFEDVWMLTSPLIIFVMNETWECKKLFRDDYILPNLLHFSRCLNEQAFNLFCNLYVDISSFCHKSPVEDLRQYFMNTALYEGASLVQDCAAIALLKYIGTTDGPIPAPLKKWFLRNINNPKLSVIADLYCKRVMESRDDLLKWDDIIIL